MRPLDSLNGTDPPERTAITGVTMYDLFFSGHAAWFSIPAILGTFFFLLRLGLMFLGAVDLDVETDTDFDAGGVDAGVDGGGDLDGDFDADHADANDLFKYLSIQTVFAFAMGFGWGALASYKGTGWSVPISIAIGVVVGIAMVYLLTILLTFLYDLRSDGTVMIKHAMGIEGDTYAQIPPSASGRGQVTVIINTRQRTYNAVTSDEAPIPTGARIRVVGIKDANTLDVTALSNND